jgi:hypothetical protein
LYVVTGVCQSLPVTLDASSNSNSLIMVTVSGDGCPHAVIAYIIIATGTATKARQKRLTIILLYHYLNLAYESLRLVRLWRTRVKFRYSRRHTFLEPCNRKAPGCLWFAAIKKEMLCFAM